MKIGLLVDGARLANWQVQALRGLPSEWEFVVYNCTNTRSRRRPFQHGLYYLLNIYALRSSQTRKCSLPRDLRIASRLDFEADYEGIWQRLPPAVLDRIAGDRPAVILKFGMGLLKVPEEPGLPCPILSYHHGDPRQFRGRPAGFYELLAGETSVGQVVQILSNRLDAGQVVAFAETKTYSHSYRKTMAEAYRRSPILLPRAIDNAVAGRTLPIAPEGAVYRLPSNWTVARHCLGRWSHLLRRLAYGAFFEKAWRVAEAAIGPSDPASLVDSFPSATGWLLFKQPRGYRFLADPFYHPSADGVLVEALRTRSARGEILHVREAGFQRLSAGANHYSYPGTCTIGDRHYLLPEISEWAPPMLYELTSDGLVECGRLAIPGNPHLVDPTLHSSSSGIYLFANIAAEGDSVLRLWHSRTLLEPFAEHPASPICVSPTGGRMAGLLVTHGDQTYRIGQDLRGSYGNGVLLFKIDELSPARYAETEVGRIQLQGSKGPHTLNFEDGRILFDFYRERFSLLAGIYRAWAARRSILSLSGRGDTGSNRTRARHSSTTRTAPGTNRARQ